VRAIPGPFQNNLWIQFNVATTATVDILIFGPRCNSIGYITPVGLELYGASQGGAKCPRPVLHSGSLPLDEVSVQVALIPYSINAAIFGPGAPSANEE
jgi:hypothetical protein